MEALRCSVHRCPRPRVAPARLVGIHYGHRPLLSAEFRGDTVPRQRVGLDLIPHALEKLKVLLSLLFWHDVPDVLEALEVATVRFQGWLSGRAQHDRTAVPKSQLPEYAHYRLKTLW